ncbi:hypothetical protein KIPB_015743, partial [Kipferlia bialata]
YPLLSMQPMNHELNAISTRAEELYSQHSQASAAENSALHCDVCGVTCIDDAAYESHIGGKKHRKRQRKAAAAAAAAADTAMDGEGEGEAKPEVKVVDKREARRIACVVKEARVSYLLRCSHLSYIVLATAQRAETRASASGENDADLESDDEDAVEHAVLR